jgi:Na+/H+ antiporter
MQSVILTSNSHQIAFRCIRESINQWREVSVKGIEEKIETSRKLPIERIIYPFQEFAKLEASGGILLLICTVAALVWANSPWASGYYNLWQTKLTISLGNFALNKPLLLWINDGLMAMSFFVVGLEIKT